MPPKKKTKTVTLSAIPDAAPSSANADKDRLEQHLVNMSPNASTSIANYKHLKEKKLEIFLGKKVDLFFQLSESSESSSKSPRETTRTSINRSILIMNWKNVGLLLVWMACSLPSIFAQQQQQQNSSTGRLFPSSFETFDPWILDPEHGYGSPMGGLARATSSRLAALPLWLPPTTQEASSAPALHTTVRDHLGRAYVCRVYHQDELEPSSLLEGMFEPPRLVVSSKQEKHQQQQHLDSPTSNDVATKDTVANPEQQQQQQKDHGSGGSQGHIFRKPLVFRPDEESVEADDDDEDDDDEDDGEMTQLSREPMKLKERLRYLSPSDQVDEVDELFESAGVDGLCAQIHQGWWSYEWCYEDSVTQFHVEISKATSTVQVEDVTDLGSFSFRKVTLVQDNDDGREENHIPAEITKEQDFHQKVTSHITTTVNPLAQGRPEVARVQDTYLHGAVCPGTTKERQTIVNLVCCGQGHLQRSKGLVHRDNIHVLTDALAIYEVSESRTNICTYNITVCTPLLCQDYHDDKAAAEKAATANPDGESWPLLKDKNARPALAKEDESVLEILERALGGFCLQTGSGGWWVYEVCHGKHVRQFHEVVGSKTNPTTGVVYTARSIEANHMLGHAPSPQVLAAIVPEDEHKFIVNGTSATTSGSMEAKRKSRSGSSGGGVTKAYFELEYVGGDLCDHSDVTDSAVVAGGTQKEGIRRASSVRYQCGDSYEISVSEDHTCHYIVIVEVPDLCLHKFFKEPIFRQQVFKCLHIPDGIDQDDMLFLEQ